MAIAATAALAGCGGGGSSTGSGAVGDMALPGSPPSAPAPTPQPVIGFAELTWTAPTLNEDGSPLTNLAGYKVHYGQSADALASTVDLPSPSTTAVRIEGLAAGTWYFSLTAYTNTGLESTPTRAVSKTIR